MPIALSAPGQGGLPVVKRLAIGETFIGAVYKTQQRNVMKNDAPVLKDNGKPRQELVVYCVTMPGTTSSAGIGETVGIPAPGDRVRLILRGRAYGDWIEQNKKLGGVNVGDVVSQTTTVAQAYDANGKPVGGEMTTQEQVSAVPRSQPVGIYGPLTLRKSTPACQQWVAAAEQAYHDALERTALDVPDEPVRTGPGVDDVF